VPLKLRISEKRRNKQNASAKARIREGNSPDHLLRSLIFTKCIKRGEEVETARRWAWKQPSYNDSVTAHWPSFLCAENIRLSKKPKQWIRNMVAEYILW